uniref:Uncharacterized protein n=1 Tax=Sphaerodactylus townsendi TaxID=933632 RepID=A0ACB8G980_9SAUR
MADDPMAGPNQKCLIMTYYSSKENYRCPLDSEDIYNGTQAPNGNPGYYDLEAQDLGIWHVPNKTPMKQWRYLPLEMNLLLASFISECLMLRKQPWPTALGLKSPDATQNITALAEGDIWQKGILVSVGTSLPLTGMATGHTMAAALLKR